MRLEPCALLGAVLPWDMDLSKHIEELRNQWLAQGKANSFEEINRGAARGGNCDTFARQVLEGLRGHENFAGASDIELANFQVEEPDEMFETEGRPLDRELLKTYWPRVQPTQGLDWSDMEQLASDANWSSGTHVWVVHQQRHYDCECPEGVENFLELPFFQRAIASWKSEHRADPTRSARRPKL